MWLFLYRPSGKYLNEEMSKENFSPSDLSKLKVVELRLLLSKHNLPTKGKKAELIER